MNNYTVYGGTVYAEEKIFAPGFVCIADGQIAVVGPLEQKPDEPSSLDIRVPEHTHIFPGAVDLHIHGADGADVMDGTGSSLNKMAAFLPSEGTTSFLATTMTQEQEAIEQALHCIASFDQTDHTAELAGIHLEGPFISKKHPGAQPADAILAPDCSLFDEWHRLSGRRIRLVTLAPEESNGLALLSHLVQSDITASAGHTDATFDQMTQASEAGLTHVTHLFNGMRGMHHREPGTAGAALLTKELYTEMIVDGIHIHPQMVRLAFEQKTADRIVLITDSMRAKGLPDGEYDLGGQAVRVTKGKAVLPDGTLAGSTLSMQKAMQNMLVWTGCSIQDLVKMTAENPARQARLFDRKGSITVGKDADIVIYNDQLELQKTICRGKIAYEKGES